MSGSSATVVAYPLDCLRTRLVGQGEPKVREREGKMRRGGRGGRGRCEGEGGEGGEGEGVKV